MNSDKDIIDVAIVGAGLGGLSAAIAIYSRNPDLKIRLFGLPYDSNTAKKGDIEIIPGIKKVVGVDYIGQILEHIEVLNKEYAKFFASKDKQPEGANNDELDEDSKRISVINEEVKSIEKEDELFIIKAEDSSIVSRTVILAMDLPELKYTMKGEKELEHKGVSYCAVCDGALFRGKKVAIIGLDNFAARGALFLRRYCRKVSVLVPSAQMDIDNRFLRKLQLSSNVKLIYNVDLDSVQIKGEQVVNSISFKAGGEEKELTINAVFIEMKRRPDLSILKNISVNTTKEGFIITNYDKSTEVKGLFATGIITGEKDYSPILMGDGFKAGLAVSEFLSI